MGFIATGGTYQHYLVIENQLKPIAELLSLLLWHRVMYTLIRTHFNQKE